jgi:hypothetical protein
MRLVKEFFFTFYISTQRSVIRSCDPVALRDYGSVFIIQWALLIFREYDPVIWYPPRCTRGQRGLSLPGCPETWSSKVYKQMPQCERKYMNWCLNPPLLVLDASIMLLWLALAMHLEMVSSPVGKEEGRHRQTNLLQHHQMR